MVAVVKFQDRSSLVSSWSTWYFEALIPWSCSCTCNIFWAKRLLGWCQTVVLQTHCHTRRKRRISKRSPIIKEVVLQVEWQQVSRLHPTYKYLQKENHRWISWGDVVCKEYRLWWRYLGTPTKTFTEVEPHQQEETPALCQNSFKETEMEESAREMLRQEIRRQNCMCLCLWWWSTQKCDDGTKLATDLRNSTNKVVVVEKQALCAREERRDGAFQMIVAEIDIVDIDWWCDSDLPWQGVAVEHQVWQLQ